MKYHSVNNNKKKGGKEMSDRKYSILRSAAGFTLIELVIVMVVLAIMAGLAIPKFLDLRADAKVSATNGSLGGVRSAVANFHASQIAKDLTPEWPTVATLTDGTVMDGTFTDNTYSADATKNDVTATTDAKGTVGCTTVPTAGADWCLNESNGEFWAATNVAGENLL